MRRLLVLPIIAAIGFVAFPAGADDDGAEPSLETRQTSVETPSGGASQTEDEVTVDVDGFGLVGLRWNGAEAAEFRVLVESDGTWTELEHFEASHDGPDPDSDEGRRAREARGRDHVSDAYVVEDPSKVRVELVDGDVSDVEVISLETTDTSTAAAVPVRADMAGRGIVIVFLAGAAIALVVPANRRKLSSTAMVTVVVLALSTFAVACDPKPGSPPPQPAIASRASWGARAPACSVKATTALYQAVVHHTAGANSYSAAQSAGIVKGIQNFHIDGNGWCDIGYNFLVDRYGNVFEGRYASTAQIVTGAHAEGYNTGSVGISVMGEFGSVAPSQAAVDSIVKVITWKFSKHGTNPYQSIHRAGKWTDSIIGHRDANQTSCPGAQLYARLGEIRNRVKPNVTKPMPFGNFEGVTSQGANQISIQGWLIDPAYPSTPAKVHVYVGGPYGVGTLVYNGITTVWRPDVAAAYPGFGTQRGFNVISQKLGPLNQACVYVSAGPGRSPAMGCKPY